MSQPTATSQSIDVLKQSCPAIAVKVPLALALIEEIDQARGKVPRSAYLAGVIDAAMTREHPHMPDTPAGEDWIDSMAVRRYAQRRHSIEIERGR